MRILRTLIVTAAAGLVALPAVQAQSLALKGSVVVTPYVGLYMPSTDIANVSASAPGSFAKASMKHQASVAMGATASYWFTDRMALEGGAVYSGSDLKESLTGSAGAASQRLTQHANVWLMNTKFMVQLLPPESDFNLRFGIGPALITRSGSAYQEQVGKDVGLTDLGAAMSLCTRFNFTQKIALRLRGEDFIYQAKLGYENAARPSDNYTFAGRTQHDFVLSAGLQLFLNR